MLCCWLLLQNPEIIKRWVNEVQEAVQSKQPMVGGWWVAGVVVLWALSPLWPRLGFRVRCSTVCGMMDDDVWMDS